MRALQHLLSTSWALRRRFDREALEHIEHAVAASELVHRAELRFAIEAALDLRTLRRCETARARANEVFAELEVWDTLEKNGVLIYVLLAEHAVEIVADHGFDDRVSEAEWRAVCDTIDEYFNRGEWRAGALAGIEGVTKLATREFPAPDAMPDELPNRPVIL